MGDGSGRRDVGRETERRFARAVEVHRAGRVVEAARHYAELLALEPGHVQTLNNLGVLLRAQGKLAAAEACYRRALALAPRNTSLSNNLGNLLRERGRLREALSHYLGAVESNAEDGALLQGLGRALSDLGRYEDAAAAYRCALDRLGDQVALAPRLELELATALLAAGRLAEGFEAFEARHRLPGRRRPFEGLASWRGEPLPPGALVVHGEAGTGDSLFFLRWLPALAERGIEYSLALSPELRPLARGLPGCRALLDERGPLAGGGQGQVKVALGSLPHLLALPEPPEPAQAGYLQVPEGPRGVIPDQAGRRLTAGLVWSGSDGDRGPGLERLLPLAGRPGLQLLALQKGSAVADLVTAGGAGLIHDMSASFGDFAELARLLPSLDLVIAVDGPVAHLCGALGLPCWLLLPFAGDWRYPRNRESTPWYPRHRLFRQREPGSWDEVIEALLTALDEELGG